MDENDLKVHEHRLHIDQKLHRLKNKLLSTKYEEGGIFKTGMTGALPKMAVLTMSSPKVG